MSEPVLFLLKATIPEGARWITVHPNGKSEKGQPVLIQPNPDGSARVIGGAGGSLNYLKLRAVKSKDDYAREAAEKKKAAADERKVQRQRDKEAGILESKVKARQAVRQQQVEHERKFVQTVGQALGWKPEDLEFRPPDNVSEASANKLAAEHHREVLKRATQAVDMQRQRLAADAEARQEAGIGEVPVTAADPATITVDDIAPLPEAQGGLGFATNYGKRAAEAGATREDIRKEADEQRTDEQRQAAVKRGETAKQVKKELQKLREPIGDDKLKADLVNAKMAVELLKAAKALKEVAKKAREANKKIDAATTAPEPKAFVLEYTADPDLDARVKQELDDELRTARTTAFLSEFKRLGGEAPEETLGKHIGVGAYNSINSLALAVGGQALVDRSVVDVLGVAGAAQVLARRIHTDMPGDAERVAEGMQEFHLQHYMEASEDSLARARELMDAAREIELGEAANGSDLQTAQELNARRRRAIVDAQKTLGQALGEMEANAALVLSLRSGKFGDLKVSMGKLSTESAIERARAIGLQRGDYTVETSGGSTFLSVNGAGQDRLAKPIDRADVEQVQRNLSIINGREDEDGWLPLGVARRPDLDMKVSPGVAPRLAQPFAPGEDLAQSLRDYIGGRAADGDTPADILADIQSADFFQKAGNSEAYQAALDAVAPLKGADGKQRRAEDLGDTFDSYADGFVSRAYGGERSPLNRQQVAVDQVSVDALHRALAAHPDGVAAYKPIGELTPQDQRALRETFYRDIAKESPEAGDLRRALEAHEAAEPEREVEDMFGETTVNPEHTDWRQRRDEMAAKANAASLDWPKYIDTMGGHEKAYEAVQDLIRSRVSQAFAETHNRLRPDAPVKLGRAVIRNNLNHLDATDHEARDARLARNRELVDGLRERVQGRYAAGAVSDKLDAAREEREAFEQAQMGFFSSEDAPVLNGSTGADKPMAADERHTLGHAAERQIAAMMAKVGANFKPGQPTKLWSPSMSGGKNYARQRLVKLVDANKRVMAAFGTGSGKTLLQQAAFTHLKEQGKAKRGLFLVPSIVQGQFNGEALRYLEGGKYRWHCEPGASREARLAAHKDGSHDFTVMTHQSFRDDMVHLGAKHAGVEEREMADRLDAMTPADRKEWMRSTLEREGINYDYLTVDESQYTLNRAGKENSSLANVVDAMSAHVPYYLAASGDPVKNDASEVFDLMSKMDPERYRDRGEFMRRYGADTLASKDALKREMARYVYPSRIDPDVQAHRREERIELSDDQRQALAEMDGHLSRARLARMQGKVDVDSMKAISPSSFDGVPADQHEALAKDLQANVGIMKQTALQRIINEHPAGAKLEKLVETAAARKGKPGVVFAHSRKAVELARQRLEAAGHRVVVITGSDSAKEKERKRLMFNPESGDAQADILIASDAGATGMNIQRGQWLVNMDTPQTAMTHAQRNGRIFRTGQKNDVELIDFVANHASERQARDRLAKKYGLRELMTSSMEGLDDTGVAHYINQRRASQPAKS